MRLRVVYESHFVCPICASYVPYVSLYVSLTCPLRVPLRAPCRVCARRACPPSRRPTRSTLPRSLAGRRRATPRGRQRRNTEAWSRQTGLLLIRKLPGLSGTGGGRRTRWRPVSRPNGRKRCEMGRGTLRRGQQQQLKPECACCDATATLLRNAIHEHSASDASWELPWELRSRGAGICRPHRCAYGAKLPLALVDRRTGRSEIPEFRRALSTGQCAGGLMGPALRI